MNVDHHRTLAAVAQSGGPNVQVQAVFAHRALLRRKMISATGAKAAVRAWLWSARSEIGGFANAFPRGRRYRSHESPPRGVGTVGNALEREDAVLNGAKDGAVRSFRLRHNAHGRRWNREDTPRESRASQERGPF